MYKELKTLLRRNAHPFHMPGHKRNADFFPPDLFRFDLTELPKTDVLSAPTGMIRLLQEKIAWFYGADESFLLVNGSSAGIVAAICATAGEKTPVFVPRNAHVSAYNGLVFSGASPTYYLPKITDEVLIGGVSPEIFDDMPRGAVALVVSPTYEGFVSDIAAIAEKVHARDGVLIVDEAHGAHFAFHEYFPTHAVALGADIVINSFHKTLPMMSPCAVLHVRSKRVDTSRVRFFLNAMQTTSPSFAMMAQCDFALEKLWTNPECFKKYAGILVNVRWNVRRQLVETDDIGKFLFSGVIKSRDVVFEMVTRRHTLAVSSVADTLEGLIAMAFAARKKLRPPSPLKRMPRFLLPEVAMSPREAMAHPSEEIPREHAIDRISAELITKYPPGIAILAPGEKIIKKAQIPKPTVRVVVEI
ncbi:MAG: hypothetical protein FWF77_07175 [Defluviitaleaceae bacterium]|nr:hypothetical protein [Defluviitaleaceae bacterium]